GRPLVGVAVWLPSGRTTVTDAQGRYEFLNLPAGVYTVSASRPGFVSVEYGQQRALEPGEPIELGRGEVRDRIDLSLPVPAAVTGRILDFEGDPVAGADVRVLQMRYELGRRRLVDVAGVAPRRSDDRGRYRLSGLPPGEYIVRALVGQVIVNVPE